MSKNKETPASMTNKEAIRILRMLLIRRVQSRGQDDYGCVALCKAIEALKGVVIDKTNFPDANFRKLVRQSDTEGGGNGYLGEAELAAVIRIDCSSKNIANLKGIKHFTALKILRCNNNELTSLDVSGFAALDILGCFNNQLTSIDVTDCTALRDFDCHANQLTSLDVSGCTSLTYLDCSGNQITSLDVSNIPAIRDAVLNGTKDSSDSDYDYYFTEQGDLYVDKTVIIITETEESK